MSEGNVDPLAGATGQQRPPRKVFGGPVNVFQLWEESLSRLKALNYEAEYCDVTNQIPFPRPFFAVQSGQTGHQFAAFVSLVSWLMRMCGEEFAVDKYDDPNTSSNKMMLALKHLGFVGDFSAQKLKQAYGVPTCLVLEFLTDLALKKRSFRWGTPVYPESEYVEEADVDEAADLGADIDDEIEEQSEEEDAMYMEVAREDLRREELDGSTQQLLEGAKDPAAQAAWKTELERVAPRLKIHLEGGAGGKEWRAHLQQTKKHETTIQGQFPTAEGQLRGVGSGVGDALERVVSKERNINAQFQHLAQEYSSIKVQLEAAQGRHTSHSETVNELTNQLQDVAEQLDDIKGKTKSRGQTMTDASPLVQIKKALHKIKNEIKLMELRIGVVGHTLTRAKMRRKTGLDAGVSKLRGLGIDDDIGDNFEISDDEDDIMMGGGGGGKKS